MTDTPGDLLLTDGAHTLTRRSLLRLLAWIEDELEDGGDVAFLAAGDVPDGGWEWLPDAARRSKTGLALVRSRSFEVAIAPPFPLGRASNRQKPDGPLGPLRDLLVRDRSVAVVLLRLGAYAVGILRDGQLVLSKTGTRYVRGRHRAGGQSQRRFERNREKWVRELFDEVCDVCRSRLGPHTGQLQHLAIGGDTHVIGQFLKRCEWLAPLAGRRLPTPVPVRRPGLAALRRAGEAVWSSRVYIRCK